MMLDIDHFKQVNDTHGHPLGDLVLQRVAQLLAQGLRAGDIACRYGGEEFLVLLPDMPLEAARARALALCEDVARLALKAGDQAVPVRISVGVASAPRHAADAAGLIRAADDALYRAKAEGRNRVELAG
jgi:diguanylate cyclase (GGDEF)-like protein